MKPLVCITGGTGFIGQYIIQKLSDLKFEYKILTRNNKLNHPILNDNNTREFNLNMSVEQMACSLKNCDIVCHVGAYVPHNNNDPEIAQLCWDMNSLGTLKLLRAAVISGVKRFIYISGANVLEAKEFPITEDARNMPLYAPYYLSSKVVGEIFVNNFADNKFQTLIIRPSSVYGIGMKTGVIKTFCLRLKMNLPLDIYDEGLFRTDFVCVEDVADVIIKAIESEHNGEVNIGSGEYISMLELAKHLVIMMNKSNDLLKIHQITTDAKVIKGFPALDITRAKQWFDFTPTPLTEGLMRYMSKENE